MPNPSQRSLHFLLTPCHRSTPSNFSIPFALPHLTLRTNREDASMAAVPSSPSRALCSAVASAADGEPEAARSSRKSLDVLPFQTIFLRDMVSGVRSVPLDQILRWVKDDEVVKELRCFVHSEIQTQRHKNPNRQGKGQRRQAMYGDTHTG